MQMYMAGMAELDTVYIRMIAGAFDYHHYNTIDFSILSYHALPCEIPCFIYFEHQLIHRSDGMPSYVITGASRGLGVCTCQISALG
jgi:hypothetical protein